MDFFRRVYSWRKLGELIDRLPSSSHYRAEIAQDDEVARAALKASGGKATAGRPPLTEMDYGTYLQAGMVSLLGQLVQSSEAHRTNGASKYRPPSLSMPETALERVQRDMEDTRHSSLVDEVREAQARWKQINE